MASPTTSFTGPEHEAAPSADQAHDLAPATEGAAEVLKIDHDGESDQTSSPESNQSVESGEASPIAADSNPAESNTKAPPLPDEPPPAQEDDGWEFHWDEANQAHYFHNRITGESTWDNPRLAKAPAAGPSATVAAAPPTDEKPPAGGYNPAIHGDYDPNAWYAQNNEEDMTAVQSQAVDPAAAYAAIGSFNRFTGRWQGDDQDPDQHNDESKSRRQMNAFFDVDAAANSHDGRSLRAERSGKKPSKTELKQFKEKRKAKKEEKRRAWLRD
jgi:hypothetical protein